MEVGTLERALAKRGEQADSPNRQYMTEDPNSDEVATDFAAPAGDLAHEKHPRQTKQL